jgi:hypothetical protein
MVGVVYWYSGMYMQCVRTLLFVNKVVFLILLCDAKKQPPISSLLFLPLVDTEGQDRRHQRQHRGGGGGRRVLAVITFVEADEQRAGGSEALAFVEASP